jgi:hypothetical protein
MRTIQRIGNLWARADAKEVGEPPATRVVGERRRGTVPQKLVTPLFFPPAPTQLAQLFLRLAAFETRPVSDMLEQCERSRPLRVRSKAAALIDLARRPASAVRGSKAAWMVSITLVNSLGVLPIVYFLRGRRG